jgi:hypothetical protein
VTRQAQTITRFLLDAPASNAVDQLVARDRQKPRDRFVRQLSLLVANDAKRRGKRLGQQISRNVAAHRSRTQKREHDDTMTAKERAKRFAVPRTRSPQQLAI